MPALALDGETSLPGLLAVGEVALAMTRSALARKESRGVHFRHDYPEHDESLAQSHTQIVNGGKAEIRARRA